MEHLVDVLALKRFSEGVAIDSAQHDNVKKLRQGFNEPTASMLDLKKIMATLIERKTVLTKKWNCQKRFFAPTIARLFKGSRRQSGSGWDRRVLIVGLEVKHSRQSIGTYALRRKSVEHEESQKTLWVPAYPTQRSVARRASHVAWENQQRPALLSEEYQKPPCFPAIVQSIHWCHVLQMRYYQIEQIPKASWRHGVIKAREDQPWQGRQLAIVASAGVVYSYMDDVSFKAINKKISDVDSTCIAFVVSILYIDIGVVCTRKPPPVSDSKKHATALNLDGYFQAA